MILRVICIAFTLHPFRIAPLSLSLQMSPLHLLLADGPYHPHLHEAHQLQSVQKAIISPPYNSHDFRMQFLKQNYQPVSKVCQYNGIRCVEGMIHTFAFTSLLYGGLKGAVPQYAMNISWLPHSIYVLYLHEVSLPGGCDTRMLPRCLQFLQLRGCNPGAIKEINLQTLPRHMEELHVQGGFNTGIIRLVRLPPKFRILQVTASKDPERIIMDPRKVPEGFEFLRVVTPMQKRSEKISGTVCFGESKVNPVRVQLKGQWSMRESHFAAELEDLLTVEI